MKTSPLTVWYLSLSIGEAKEYQKKFKDTLDWSNSVWHNKINSKTIITKAEQIIIEQITKQNIF